MGEDWSSNTIKGALQSRVVSLILDYDEDLLRRLIEARQSSRPIDWSNWTDLSPQSAVLCQLCLVILNKESGVTVADLFRHLRWTDWDRLLRALCLLFEIDPTDWDRTHD